MGGGWILEQEAATWGQDTAAFSDCKVGLDLFGSWWPPHNHAHLNFLASLICVTHLECKSFGLLSRDVFLRR